MDEPRQTTVEHQISSESKRHGLPPVAFVVPRDISSETAILSQRHENGTDRPKADRLEPECGPAAVAVDHRALFEAWLAEGSVETLNGPRRRDAAGVVGGPQPAQEAEADATRLVPKETSVTEPQTTISSTFMHSGWADDRKRVAAALGRTGQPAARVTAFCQCGSHSWLERNNADADRYRVRQNRCHDRLCRPCAKLRSLRIRDALMALVGTTPVKFITLTLTGLPKENLTAKVSRLYKGFRALRRHPIWENVYGGAAFLEVKWNTKSGRWHPHLHLICRARYIDKGLLSAAWMSITGDSFIVDISQARTQNGVAAYVTDYASKTIDMSFIRSPERLDEAVVAMKGRRLCTCFGDWYGTPLSNIEDTELANDEIDAAGWHSMIHLDDAIRQAMNGDAWAAAALTSAGWGDRLLRFMQERQALNEKRPR